MYSFSSLNYYVCSFVQVRVIKTEEERSVMERKAAETEVMVHRMVEEAERRQSEADRLRGEVATARDAEKEAKNKLLDFLNASMSEINKVSPGWAPPPAPHTPNGVQQQLTLEDLTQSAYDLSGGGLPGLPGLPGQFPLHTPAHLR